MAPCKILIADDEKLAREAIKMHLPASVEAEIVAECADGKEALEAIIRLLPDVIFLDIKMPALTGFEVLQALPTDYYPYIIIVTAFDMYALEAYQHDAADYLLKPFTRQRFDKAVEKAFRHWKANATDSRLSELGSFTERIQSLLQAPTSEVKKFIAIKDGIKIYFVQHEDVLFIEAGKDYVTVHTKQKKYLHKETMQGLTANLPTSFVRIHKSCIVNMQFVKELQSLYNGDHIVLLHTGHSLRLSRSYRDNLMRNIR